MQMTCAESSHANAPAPALVPGLPSPARGSAGRNQAVSTKLRDRLDDSPASTSNPLLWFQTKVLNPARKSMTRSRAKLRPKLDALFGVRRPGLPEDQQASNPNQSNPGRSRPERAPGLLSLNLFQRTVSPPGASPLINTSAVSPPGACTPIKQAAEAAQVKQAGQKRSTEAPEAAQEKQTGQKRSIKAPEAAQ